MWQQLIGILADRSAFSEPELCSLGLLQAFTPCSFEENLDKKAFGGPRGYAQETAKCKALDVKKALEALAIVPDLIISADTVFDPLYYTLLPSPLSSCLHYSIVLQDWMNFISAIFWSDQRSCWREIKTA